MELTKTQKYNAILTKDSSFEGIFYTCVKTTGVFCRPVCNARKPKIENVEFVSTAKEAITKGYRPCKLCHPLENPNNAPNYIRALIHEVQSNPHQRITDETLRSKNLEPSTIRRWFLKNHGLTFHAFQRMFRINTAFKKIKTGSKVVDSAFNSGFDSLSSFNDNFKNIFGVAPSKSKTIDTIEFTRLETPLGTMVACATDQGISLLEFSDRRMLETELKLLTKQFNAVIIPGKNHHLQQLSQELTEYFAGTRTVFNVNLDIRGTDFQKQVWKELTTIPYGKTRSYQQQATNIGKPKAVRAVANANGMNKIAIVIPCHRVIGSDGSLTGYGGGVWRKQWLLEMEQK